MYPNPSDPLNAEAAQLQMKSTEQYNSKVKMYVQKYAKQGADEAPKCILPQMKEWQSNGIDNLSDTSDIEMMEVSD